MSPLLLLLAMADAGAALPPEPDAPTVVARANRIEAKVGDWIEVTITAIGSRATPVNLPATPDLSPFVVLSRREEERDLGDGRYRRDFVLTVAAYEPGEASIPAVEVTYLGKEGAVLSTRTLPVPIKIASMLANEPEPALKDNAPPVEVLERNLLVVYLGAGLVVFGLGALVTSYVRRRLRLRAANLRPPPPPRPAHEIALERLDRLGAQLADDFDYRPFYFELSEIVRDYLGARFGFESLELTTEELVDELSQRAARELVMGEVAGWLSGCDLVKFAKIAPSVGEARGALETAIRIVDSTRPRPEPQAPPTATGPDSPKVTARG